MTRKPVLQTRACRSGFTMLELLVAIVIISVFVALLLPALNSARSHARRIKCQSNLKNIGLATQNFIEVFGHFPRGKELLGHYAVPLMPYVEQQAVYDILIQPGVIAHPQSALGSVSVPVWICPDDSLSSIALGHQNYLFNAGLGLESRHPGMLTEFSSPELRPENILDGLSQTALASERLIDVHLRDPGSAAPPPRSPDERRTMWFTTRQYARNIDQAGLFLKDCTETSTTDLPPYRVGGLTYWGDSQGYNHTFTPNSKSCFNGPTVSSIWDVSGAHWDHSARSASSDHIGDGVNVLNCDGAVNFHSSRIDLKVWHALATTGKGDVL